MYLNKTQQIIAASVASLAFIGAGIGIGAGIWASGGGSSQPSVVLITDAGQVDDRSFNQQAWEATQAYGGITNEQVSYAKPSDTETGTLSSIYNNYLSNGARSLVLPGFLHLPAISNTYKSFEDKQFVFIDDSNFNFISVQPEDILEAVKNGEILYLNDNEGNPTTEPLKVYQYTSTSGEVIDWNYGNGNQGWTTQDLAAAGNFAYANVFSSYDNVSAIKYYSEQAGFATAIITSIYLTENFSSYKDWVASGWTGIFASSTGDYLSGYIQGFNFYNEYILGNAAANPYYAIEGENNGDYVKVVSPKGSNDSVNNSGVYTWNGTKEVDNWQSGSFDRGDSETVVISAAGSNKGAHVFFPIAGPQFADVLDFIDSDSNNEYKLIGVDTDASKVFPDQSDDILTSALKTINDTDIDGDGQAAANSGGPVTKSLYDYEVNKVTNDYIGTIANGGVGFTTNEQTNSDFTSFIAKLETGGSTADSRVNYNINSSLETYLTSIHSDLSDFTLSEFVIELILFVDNPANQVLLVDQGNNGTLEGKDAYGIRSQEYVLFNESWFQ